MSKELSSPLLPAVIENDDDSHSIGDQTTKKVKFKGGVVDASGGVEDVSEDMVVEPNLTSMLSWKDKLFGENPNNPMMDCNGSSFGRVNTSNNDFDLRADDVQTSIINGVPTINFSDRVKEILFKEMELTLVIKLLGRNIGYNTLLNRITSLWKPISPIHLMDIENGYYLVRFVNKADYDRLPGFLFRRQIVEAIGGLIGKGVKLDFQTDNRSRGRFARLGVFLNLKKPLISQVLVDGAVQRVEYEALPTVCFGCGKYGHVKDLCPTKVEDRTFERPSELVTDRSDAAAGGVVEETGPECGPWMLVKRRSWRGSRNGQSIAGANKGLINEPKIRKETSKSRFSVLIEGDKNRNFLAVNDDKLSVEDAKMTVEGVGVLITKAGDNNLGNVDLSAGPNSKPILGNGSSKEAIMADLELMVSGRLGDGPGGSSVPISDGILDPGKHSAISFKDTSHKKEKNNSVNITWGKKGDGIPISKERHRGKDSFGCNSRKASNVLRGRGGRFKASGNFRVPLVESIEEMAKLISNLNPSNDINSVSNGAVLITNGGTVNRHNKFPRIFREYNREYKPDIISLLETRFILTHVGSTSSTTVVFISFIYGSPNRQKRKDLWDTLKRSIPMENYPWIAIEDFNAILSSSKKLGGMSKGRRCPLYGDFVGKAELHDLGYREPPFTWHKGLLFERLDRALGNSAWVQRFPNSLVTHFPKIKFDHRPLLLSLNLKIILPRGRPFRFLAGWVEHPNFWKIY
ncbi:uncharacterized protein LOC108462689 [Gossypium arboreum]|uniref:uncharacterized protein LOC108462689 n=1 Tax=Gossypium arboreum TaxID=29729 RepID=UPI0008193C38|nr:uncharacterized protein LOC108462689 [Gossypium arboreum]